MRVFPGTDEYDIPRELSVCFSGHRPDKLPWGSRESDDRCAEFCRKLEREIVRAYKQGARYFLSGMADGVDVIAAEAVLRLAVFFPEIRLIAVFPYGTGDSSRKRSIAERAYGVVSLNGSYVTACYSERNRFLVRHSKRLICCSNGDMRTGTGMTLRMAGEEGLDIVIINV